MRTPVIAGNWKMHLLAREAVSLATEIMERTGPGLGPEVIVCPVFTVLREVAKALNGSEIAVGGQDCYHEASGAFTGEIAPQMLRDAGCRWVIIGHSERRQYFNESDDLLNRKLRFALDAGLHVMYCVGETFDEREDDRTEAVLRSQVRKGLADITAEQCERLVIAYEPVWAIGSGRNATPEQAQEAHRFIRSLVNDRVGGTAAEGLRIQYGGSVKPENARDILAQADVDGALVGGASLEAESFAAIVQAARDVR